MANEREIGELSARMLAVERELKEVKTDMKSVLAKLNEAKGFKAGMTMIIASIGGLVVFVGQKLSMLVGFIPK